MADEPANEDAPRRSPPVWLPTRRTLLLCGGFLVPCAVIAVSVFSIAKHTTEPSAPASVSASSGVPAPSFVEPEAANVAGSASAALAPSAEPSAPESAASADNPEAPTPGFDDETDDGEPSPVKHVAPKHFATVQEAALGSCSTASVEGLSRQIIAQARCIKQSSFVPLPTRANLVLAPHVFPYLELEAQKHLVKALDARQSAKMTINSALRTVAQQYLVWRWSAVKRCGVQLATPPGESNHEIGFALDIAEAGQWRSALEAQQFHWLGASDRVHFDFTGANATPHSATDVLAFQTLWNRNHPHDTISADGHYTPTTEQRLKKAPTDGFPLGPSCRK